MNFTWHFGQIKGNNYSFPLPGLSNITVQYFAEKGFGPVVIFANKLLLLNQTYIMKLVVTKDYRASSVFQVIRLQNEEPPRVSQRYIFRRYSNLNLFCCSHNSNWHWLSISHRPGRRDVLLDAVNVMESIIFTANECVVQPLFFGHSRAYSVGGEIKSASFQDSFAPIILPLLTVSGSPWIFCQTN